MVFFIRFSCRRTTPRDQSDQQKLLKCSVDLKGPSARYDLITSPKGKRLLNEMTWTAASDYRGVIKLERELIEQIDKLYPTASH